MDSDTKRLGFNTLQHCDATIEFKLALLNNLTKKYAIYEHESFLNDTLCELYDIIANKKLTK